MDDRDGDPGAFATQAGAGLLLLVILALIAGHAFGADGGSYADWLAAVGTLAAFAAALVAAWYASRAYAKEVRRDRERDQLARREQASLVATWPGPVLVVPDFLVSASPGSREVVQVTVMVRNASQLPITSVEIDVQVSHYSEDSVRVSTPLLEIVIPLVPPGVEAREVTKVLPNPVPISQLGIQNLDELQAKVRTTMTFRDAADRRWTRSSEGHLGEVIESGDTL